MKRYSESHSHHVPFYFQAFADGGRQAGPRGRPCSTTERDMTTARQHSESHVYVSGLVLVLLRFFAQTAFRGMRTYGGGGPLLVALLLHCAAAHRPPTRSSKRHEKRHTRLGKRFANEVFTASTDRVAPITDLQQDPLGYYSFSWKPPTDECGTEQHADYDGIRAVSWGATFRKKTAAECCDACKAHPKCNSWVFCPEPLCFSPDVWNHTEGECWLKVQRNPSKPSVNMRGAYTERYRRRRGHHRAPSKVQWVSGVVRLSGQVVTNGTWSERAKW